MAILCEKAKPTGLARHLACCRVGLLASMLCLSQMTKTVLTKKLVIASTEKTLYNECKGTGHTAFFADLRVYYRACAKRILCKKAKPTGPARHLACCHTRFLVGVPYLSQVTNAIDN